MAKTITTAHAVRVPTTKKCRRCNGKGIGMWGMTYGECFRCGGNGFEMTVDVPATMAQFTATLMRIQQAGEAAKAVLASNSASPLTRGNARRDLEFARRQYREVLTERHNFMKEFNL